VPSGAIITGSASIKFQGKKNKTNPKPIAKNKVFLFLENNLNILGIFNYYIIKTHKIKREP